MPQDGPGRGRPRGRGAGWRRRFACSETPVLGCGDAPLAAFQLARGVHLPAAYLLYLRGVGADPGDFLSGSDLRFDELDSIRETAGMLLEDDDQPPLSPDVFVFCGHQAYQFLFFRPAEGPDPAIWHYLEASGGARQVATSFSQWLVQAVRDEFPRLAAAPT